MSENREAFNDWVNTLNEKLLNKGNSINNNCKANTKSSTNFFYLKFGDTLASYDPDVYSFSCDLSPDGLPTGKGVITRSKTWVWPKCSGFNSWPVIEKSTKLHSMEGFWENGISSGLQAFTYCNGVTFRTVFEFGVAQGLAVGSFKEKIIWVGRYMDGQLMGEFCSIEPDAGALLLGDMVDGEMSGPDLTFLYPDLETGLRGSWQGGVMVAARQVVVNCVWVEDDQVRVSCSASFGPEFAFAPSEVDNFGASDPMMKDPFESKYIAVEESTMEGGGQGVYAKVDLPKNRIAAIFNGYKISLYAGISPAEGIEEEEKIYERLSYNIHMPEDEDFFIDLPPSKADLSVYCASLGHKVNHSFIPNCRFGTMFHPRWGRVRTVETMEEVEEGQELLVDYGYDLLRCPEWYRELWTRELGGSGMKYWEYKK